MGSSPMSAVQSLSEGALAPFDDEELGRIRILFAYTIARIAELTRLNWSAKWSYLTPAYITNTLCSPLTTAFKRIVAWAILLVFDGLI